jgi:hypothetical protein
MRMKLERIAQDVQELYSLADFEHHGHIYMEISKEHLRSPSSRLPSSGPLVKHLKANKYIQCTNSPSLFRHKTRDIAFTLVMDDFGIMYTRDEEFEHFLATLRKQHEITEDRGNL